MKNRRRHLGPGYTQYPAKRIATFLSEKSIRIVLWLLCCALWSGVYYVAIVIVNMNRNLFGGNAEPMTNSELYCTPISLGVFGAGCLILLRLVHKASRGERRTPQKQHEQNTALKRPVK